VNEQYEEIMTIIALINAQLNESEVILSSASQQFADTLSGMLPSY